ncbi:MAG: hypothetical protein ABSF22_19295 [Bryobacteraceae bacterium]
MRYYIHGGPSALRFELAGDLNAGDASRLEQAWRRVSSAIGNRLLVVDMSFVTGIDEAARSLFKRWYTRGVEFAAGSKQSRELVESITERPYTRESPHEPTYQPWFSYTKARRKSENTSGIHSTGGCEPES